MNILKAKAKIRCNTCGCQLKRVKSIKVLSTSKAEATMEADEKLRVWRGSLVGENCKVCESIIKELAA